MVSSNSIVIIKYTLKIRERLAEEKELLVELGSDQTSCHNPFNGIQFIEPTILALIIILGGYYPVGYSFAEANRIMAEDQDKFAAEVKRRFLNNSQGLNSQ
jgi:urocanate hydratase